MMRRERNVRPAIVRGVSMLTAADEVDDLHLVALRDHGRGVGHLLDDQPVVLDRDPARVDLKRLKKSG